jgi:uncharacterized membrane protein
MKCASCQNEIPAFATFCAVCGSAVGVGGGAAAAPAPVRESRLDTKAAACAYLTFVPALCLLRMERHKRSEFVRFHAIQCIALTGFALSLLLVLEATHVVGPVVLLAVTVVFAIAWILAWHKARKGEMYELPLVGELATKHCKVRAQEKRLEAPKYYAA